MRLITVGWILSREMPDEISCNSHLERYKPDIWKKLFDTGGRRFYLLDPLKVAGILIFHDDTTPGSAEKIHECMEVYKIETSLQILCNDVYYSLIDYKLVGSESDAVDQGWYTFSGSYDGWFVYETPLNTTFTFHKKGLLLIRRNYPGFSTIRFIPTLISPIRSKMRNHNPNNHLTCKNG